MSLYQFAKSWITYLKDNFGTFPDKGFIAGGSLANLIWEQKSGNVAKINDIDIFIYKFELAALVFDYIFIFISYNNFMQLFIPVCFGQLLGYCFTTTIALTHL